MLPPQNDNDYYLVSHSTRQKQRRPSRRAAFSGCQVIHTAESTPDLVLPDNGAEGVAAFIANRTGYGSYHSVSDSDSIVWMVPLSGEAFHDGTGSNRWSVGHSAACKAEQWPTMPEWWKTATIINLARAAAATSAWAVTQGLPATPPRRITRAESEAGEPGFISHGERDPGRRSDPGEQFPWGLFLTTYAELAGEPMPPTAHSDTPDSSAVEDKPGSTLEQRVAELEAIAWLSTNPASLVRAAYKLVFKRAPDKTGRLHWTGYLADGGSVADLLYLFRMSPESKG